MGRNSTLNFEQNEPLVVKGYVVNWDGTGHHVDLLQNGYVPYHWRDTRSFDTDEYEPTPSQDSRKMNNAKGAMNRLSELSLAGGQAAIRADDHDSIFIGKVDPGCLWTGSVEFPNGKNRILKGFRFAEMAEVKKSESDLTKTLADALNQNRGTLGNANDEDTLLVYKLVQRLDSDNRLE